jgi:methionine biosynthesis protein MetW
MKLLFGGAMPTSRALPDQWYETPNIHLCTIHDFRALCAELGIGIERSMALNDAGHDKRIVTPRWANLLAEHGLFLLHTEGVR